MHYETKNEPPLLRTRFTPSPLPPHTHAHTHTRTMPVAESLFNQLNEALAGGDSDAIVKGLKVCVGADERKGGKRACLSSPLRAVQTVSGGRVGGGGRRSRGEGAGGGRGERAKNTGAADVRPRKKALTPPAGRRRRRRRAATPPSRVRAS